jgi:hypothetical protein
MAMPHGYVRLTVVTVDGRVNEHKFPIQSRTAAEFEGELASILDEAIRPLTQGIAFHVLPDPVVAYRVENISHIKVDAVDPVDQEGVTAALEKKALGFLRPHPR